MCAMKRAWYLAGWGYVGISAALVYSAMKPAIESEPYPAGALPAVQIGSGSSAAQWFETVRPHCNALEVELQMQSSLAPDGWEGVGYAASCWAIAGRIENARERLMTVAAEERESAAGILFGVGHPIADAGDDRSAGPIMQLVAEFQPWNYMATYHAGMSYYAIGQPALARTHLERFLDQYDINDGWRSNAREVLDRLRSGGRD
jgi:hypothetical protein